MGDADDSYDFEHLEPFLDRLRDGDDLVMGNRFAGGIEPGAMPWLHRYLGNPVLSAVGRLFFRVPVRRLPLRPARLPPRLGRRRWSCTRTGMEFASEMVVKATLADLRITEVPTTLRPDGRTRAPHLRTWRDGWRHLRFLLLYSPRWLFLIPGLIVFLFGLLATMLLTIGDVTIGSVTFSVSTLVYSAALAVIGFQAVAFALFTKIYAVARGFLPPDSRIDRFGARFRLERGIYLGALVFLAGLVGTAIGLWRWRDTGFGDLDTARQLRVVVPSALGLMLGSSLVLSSFFLSILGMDKRIDL